MFLGTVEMRFGWIRVVCIFDLNGALVVFVPRIDISALDALDARRGYVTIPGQPYISHTCLLPSLYAGS
jgi:hypothetical protein